MYNILFEIFANARLDIKNIGPKNHLFFEILIIFTETVLYIYTQCNSKVSGLSPYLNENAKILRYLLILFKIHSF